MRMLGDSGRKSMEAMLARVTDPGHYQSAGQLQVRPDGDEVIANMPYEQFEILAENGRPIQFVRLAEPVNWVSSATNREEVDSLDSIEKLQLLWRQLWRRPFGVRSPPVASFRVLCQRDVTPK